jgi:hypothetical protein
MASSRVPLWQSLGLPLAAAALTPVAYLLWLGWHELRDKTAYEAWQVVGLALTLGLLVIVATWLSTGLGNVVAAVVTVTLTVVWSWDAATTHTKFDQGLWPVGAIFLFTGSAVGFAAAIGVTHLVKTLLRLPPRRPPRTTA